MRKYIIITGSKGQIGECLFEKLNSKENYLICIDSNYNKNIINNSYIKYKLDISKEKDVIKFFKFLKKNKINKVDSLINNAAIQFFKNIEKEDYNDFLEVLKVNVGGVFLMIKYALDFLKKSNKPNIINLGSIYGLVSGDPNIYTDTKRNTSDAYAASKAAIIQLSRYYAIHLSKYKIRVNSISPGGIYRNQGADFVKNYSKKTPSARMAKVEEIVNSIIFLLDQGSSYINGHNLVVDGGFTSW
tara:strand:+ start:194 stop:925 length:732 start_codon:yes stop_codon:yes gene_type:complete